jgi:glycosyltransferase involved in cell wall biosynthesis
MRIVYFGDSYHITTGLAQVTRTIVDALCYDHKVEIIAMNHWEEEHPKERRDPFVTWPCINKDYRNVETARERILKADYDILIYSADVGYTDIFAWAMLAMQQRPFLFVAYVPVDCDIVHASAFDCLQYVNMIATYTEHGAEVIKRLQPTLADRVNVIPLACQPDTFYPLDPEQRTQLRQEVFGIGAETLLVGSVDRNQPRKDLGRLMMYFHEYHKRNPQSLLYLHCAQNDLGGCLPAMAMSMGMVLEGEEREIIFTSSDYSITQGIPSEWLNKIYNMFDVFASCSTGEGYGLTKTEAMCAATPVMLPRNTASIELVGDSEERGFLVETGGDLDHQVFLYGLVNYPRDIVHADSFLNTLEYIRCHPDVARYRADKAREWTLNRTPDKIADYWKKLGSIAEELQEVPS